MFPNVMLLSFHLRFVVTALDGRILGALWKLVVYEYRSVSEKGGLLHALN